ncbi:hypothetical protein [Nocardia sp. NPDC004604]|uniref:hypothetical protein n=1 Tax=Nocardia sp. NPDC004604 TaxID=3157013 RepID=UPI0033A62B23
MRADSGPSYDLVVDAYADGRKVRGVVSGPDAYRDTAVMAVEVAIRLAAHTTKAGALAETEAFDAAELPDAQVPYDITWRLERA